MAIFTDAITLVVDHNIIAVTKGDLEKHYTFATFLKIYLDKLPRKLSEIPRRLRLIFKFNGME